MTLRAIGRIVHTLTTDTYTVDELARAAGVTTTTIRLYQGKGLLPGPELRGRVGHYGAAHLARLRLIGALQERGFSLAAIRSLVDTWERGATLRDVLGLEEQLAGPAEEPVVLDGDAFAALFPSGVVDPALARRAVELGLVELRGAEVVVRRPRFLRIGQELVDLGLSMEEVLDEYAHLRDVAEQVARRFADLFERRFWAPAAAEGLSEERIVELTATLARLRSLASSIVEATVADAVDRVAGDRLAEQARKRT
ncbi:MAG TPA: MerR family transcriptional regulator [Acidimicrobiales bacterium]|nr:MerR family transcriptional regulator [Acidimicrobiales bacterium]